MIAYALYLLPYHKLLLFFCWCLVFTSSIALIWKLRDMHWRQIKTDMLTERSYNFWYETKCVLTGKRWMHLEMESINSSKWNIYVCRCEHDHEIECVTHTFIMYHTCQSTQCLMLDSGLQLNALIIIIN